MPKQVTSTELQAVVEAVKARPTGASVEDIVDLLAIPLPRRTLQRRLALLVDLGLLIGVGRGRGSRYALPLAARPRRLSEPSGPDDSRFRSEIYIPLSAEAELIKEAVRQPRHLRKPVGYNREFLENYRPNETFYLPVEVREHLAAIGGAPTTQYPAGTYARQIFNRLLIDLSWNSSRLEGNSYSLLETERLLELGEAADDKDVLQAQMIINHKHAIEFMVDSATELRFNRATVLNIHALLSQHLLLDESACGRLRSIPVGIAHTVYWPLTMPQLIDECFQQILDSAAVIRDPFEQAFFALVHFPYLQPFEDLNKRVSRLAANLPFIRDNLSPLSFIDVPVKPYIDGILGVYELNRVELLRDVFVWAYERSSGRYSAVRQELSSPDPFKLYHRKIIGQTIKAIVQHTMNKTAAVAYIRQQAQMFPPPEDNYFIEVIETQLMSLHEANCIRFALQPAEFTMWKSGWV